MGGHVGWRMGGGGVRENIQDGALTIIQRRSAEIWFSYTPALTPLSPRGEGVMINPQSRLTHSSELNFSESFSVGRTLRRLCREDGQASFSEMVTAVA